MIAAGVPVTPAISGEDQDPERLQREAEAIGYPVLIKAVAGGGGKGMRRVNAAAEFARCCCRASARRRPRSATTGVLIEKYVERPRHIEVQVFGDTHGNVVHLFERDCSLQRRHQKVIEEAPRRAWTRRRAPGVRGGGEGGAGGRLCRRGTIEFIADASEGLRADRIWFMEMNTRLQVEHPVTEEITGQDLVEWQLRVASGEALPKRQEELSINGWAIEARLYGGGSSDRLLPSTGRLDQCHFPEDYVRIDTGVEQGSTISPFYDPMIAKVIVHADDRENARVLLTRQAGGPGRMAGQVECGLPPPRGNAPRFR
jgi:3-methylcrotonyl-CoA carboxylase alpha subunit